MDNTSTNIFNYYVGGLALLSALISTVLYCRTYLPVAQMKMLDELLQETNDIYRKAEAEGLLPPTESSRIKLETKLKNLEKSSSPLREVAYNATTTLAEFGALMKGLSRQIMQKSYEVRRLRAVLITTTEERKRRLEELRRAAEFSGSNATAAQDTAGVTQALVEIEQFPQPILYRPDFNCAISPPTPCHSVTAQTSHLLTRSISTTSTISGPFSDRHAVGLTYSTSQASQSSISSTSTITDNDNVLPYRSSKWWSVRQSFAFLSRSNDPRKKLSLQALV